MITKSFVALCTPASRWSACPEAPVWNLSQWAYIVSNSLTRHTLYIHSNRTTEAEKGEQGYNKPSLVLYCTKTFFLMARVQAWQFQWNNIRRTITYKSLFFFYRDVYNKGLYLTIYSWISLMAKTVFGTCNYVLITYVFPRYVFWWYIHQLFKETDHFRTSASSSHHT